MRRRMFLAGGAGAVAVVSARSVVGCCSPADDTRSSEVAVDEMAHLASSI